MLAVLDILKKHPDISIFGFFKNVLKTSSVIILHFLKTSILGRNGLKLD